MPFLKIKHKNIFVGSQDITNVNNTKSTGQTSPNMLKEFNARVVYYDQLISNARYAYSAYFNQKDKLNPILDIFVQNFYHNNKH